MALKGIINQVIEDINNGIPRDILNEKYNKATVTKAYKKIENPISEPIENENNKEKEIGKLFNEIFKLINKNEEYEIKINITKKSANLNVEQQKSKLIKEIENPFDLIYTLGDENYLSKLKKYKRDELIEIIKKYFSLNKNKMDKLSKEELANYIITETKKILNIGLCFK